MPPQPPRKGASAQTARAMPVHAVIGLTIEYSRTSSYKVCSDRLTVRFFIATTKKLRPDTRKGQGLHPKWAWSQKFCARFARKYYNAPPNITIFLRLCCIRCRLGMEGWGKQVHGCILHQTARYNSFKQTVCRTELTVILLTDKHVHSFGLDKI